MWFCPQGAHIISGKIRPTHRRRQRMENHSPSKNVLAKVCKEGGTRAGVRDVHLCTAGEGQQHAGKAWVLYSARGYCDGNWSPAPGVTGVWEQSLLRPWDGRKGSSCEQGPLLLQNSWLGEANCRKGWRWCDWECSGETGVGGP